MEQILRAVFVSLFCRAAGMEKEPVMRQTARSGGAFGQDPQLCSSSRLTSEILSTGRAQAPFRQR